MKTMRRLPSVFLAAALIVGAASVAVAPLAAQCRFRDCRHLSEPGCAVSAAAIGGTLSARRLELYRRIVASP